MMESHLGKLLKEKIIHCLSLRHVAQNLWSNTP